MHFSITDQITNNTFVSFVNQLRDASPGEPVDVSLYTPGGNAFAGFAIAAELQKHNGPVTAKVNGLCGSIGTVVACAADTIEMDKNAWWMIHNSQVTVRGESKDLRKMADISDTINNHIADVYAWKTGKDVDDIHAMMANESMLTADQAADYGFVDLVTADRPTIENLITLSDMDFAQIKNELKTLVFGTTEDPKTPENFEAVIDTVIENLLPAIDTEIETRINAAIENVLKEIKGMAKPPAPNDPANPPAPQPSEAWAKLRQSVNEKRKTFESQNI